MPNKHHVPTYFGPELLPYVLIHFHPFVSFFRDDERAGIDFRLDGSGFGILGGVDEVSISCELRGPAC